MISPTKSSFDLITCTVDQWEKKNKKNKPNFKSTKKNLKLSSKAGVFQ